MDHAEARELLELAAIEPDGLDRLMAGDTTEAAALAGHLAGCDACGVELERLGRASAIVRVALQGGSEAPAAPPADLRARTLAYVREVGRERPERPAALASGPVRAVVIPARRLRSFGRWLAVAAAIVVAAGIGGLVVGGQLQSTVDGQAATIAALGRVNTWTLRVGGEPDAATVALASTSGGDEAGTLLFSPASGELVVVMNGIAEPPAGWEYRCWVVVDGERRQVGKMFFGGDLGYWVGPVEGLDALPPGTVFGVSLVEVSAGPPGDPVLQGSL